jgi:hypothetical protein
MTTQTASQSPTQKPPESANDRVLVASRVLAAIIVPILVGAFIMLYLLPNDTGRLFAWPIKPPMSAMMLGATYLGGAYFFSRVAISRQWHTVRLGFLPVSTFAGILGVATLLHWDKFTHGHISFELWAFLYFTLPFVIPVVWYLNQQANRGSAQPAEQPFTGGLRLAIGATGVVLAVASALLLVFPELMIPAWPWSLTPLTARVLAAMFALPGLVGLGVAIDGCWSSASIIFQAQGISILLILIAMARTLDEIQWGQAGIWSFIGGLLLVILLVGLAYLQSSRRTAQSIATGES